MKHADDCTYKEMDERFRSEVHRNDDPAVIDNMRAFRSKYATMRDGETIREFEHQTRDPS